ncbi:MAG TPA: DinB family protein [Flavobacterium sp.]
MTQAFEITQTGRNGILMLLQNYSLEQLNEIPLGFNNNMIWNAGHIVVVHQMLVYKLSGLPMLISDEMVEKYKRGTRPDQFVEEAEVLKIKSLLGETVTHTKADFDAGIFKSYNEFTTMVGYTIRSAEDAMAFNYYHEAVHTGMMMSIRKFI